MNDHDTTNSEAWATITDEADRINGTELPENVRLIKASEIEPLPVRWLWKEATGGGRIPTGVLCIFAGREGTGKSSSATDLTAKITTGTLPGEFCGRPRPVIYVSIEESWPHAIVPKLIAAGANLDLVFRMDMKTEADDEVTISLPENIGELEQTIKHLGAAVVIIDPLMSVIGARLDTHKERDIRRALDPLARIANGTSCTIIGIAHFNKSNGTDPAQLITGSGAFKNVARTIFAFAAEPDGSERVMSLVKSSLGPTGLSLAYKLEPFDVDTKLGLAETVRFVITGPATRHVSEVLGDAGASPEEVADRTDAATFIRDYLDHCDGGQANPQDVIKAGRDAGFAAQTIKNARKKVATSSRTGFGKDQVTTWELLTDTAGTASP